MTTLAPGSSSAAALLNPVKPSIATISLFSRHVSGLGGQPGFEDLLGSARDHIQQPGGTDAIVDGRHIQDDGDDSCPRMGCGATRVHPRQ